MYRTQAISFILQQESNKINFACHPLVFRLGNSLTSAQIKQVSKVDLHWVRDSAVQGSTNIINQCIYQFYSYAIGFICQKENSILTFWFYLEPNKFYRFELE